MAVITRYVVVRNGVESDRVFDDKKEAEAYDKMLDAADSLADMIKESGIVSDEKIIGDIAVFLAEKGAEVSNILKGVKSFSPSEKTEKEKPAKKPPKSSSESK